MHPTGVAAEMKAKLGAVMPGAQSPRTLPGIAPRSWSRWPSPAAAMSPFIDFLFSRGLSLAFVEGSVASTDGILHYVAGSEKEQSLVVIRPLHANHARRSARRSV